MNITKKLVAFAVLGLFPTTTVWAAQLTISDEPEPATNQEDAESPGDAEVADATSDPFEDDVREVEITYGNHCRTIPRHLFPTTCGGLNIGGWLQFGHHSDFTPQSKARGDALAFNDVPNGFNLHQFWLYAEKVAESDGYSWDWGFRGDLVYGTDAQKTQAFGGTGWDTDWINGVYGLAAPQLYIELAKGDLSIKAGHFYTLIGYEVVTAPDNFFYSHALTMFNSEPFTHSGVLATYAVSDNLEAYAGWTAGWDTGFESIGDGSNFLGGFAYSLGENISLTYITTAGDFGARGSQAYSHSLLFDVTLTERLNYVLQSDLLSVASTGEDDLGINQYLFYTVNDCVSLGGRVEWWKNDGIDNYEITGGMNIKPRDNIVVRPELRWDRQPATSFDQTTFGIDAILMY